MAGSTERPMGGAAQIPPGLLAAAAALGDARISLVVGAGCSRELPTDLPLSPALSRRLHRSLVGDQVLQEKDCADPGDLSLLADAVFDKTGGQRELVKRMDIARMKSAKPNDGYKIAIALMLENVVRTVVTLNFDLALNHAIAAVGGNGRVSTLKAPEEWSQFSDRTVIYLHRNVESDPEQLVLRSEQLNAGWKSAWGQLVGLAAVGSPVCVFAGLGTPMAVWIESTKLVNSAVGGNDVYLVGPDPFDDSNFAGSVSVDQNHYVRLGWCDFMRALARRTIAVHAELLVAAVADIDREAGRSSPGIEDTVDRWLDAGLVRSGQARSVWLEQKSGYWPLGDATAILQVADLLRGIWEIESATNSRHRLEAEGVVEFHSGDQFLGRAMFSAGAGVRKAEAMRAKVLAFVRSVLTEDRTPSVAILAGVSGDLEDSTPPEDIVDGNAAESVVFRPATVFLTLDDVRRQPSLLVNAWGKS